MAKINEEMKRVVGEQRLGFMATVCEDGTPNLSPKGLTFVLDDEHLVIGEGRSMSLIPLRERVFVSRATVVCTQKVLSSRSWLPFSNQKGRGVVSGP